MKQVIQSARTGDLSVRDVPPPKAGPGEVLVRTHASLISAGTERLVVGFAKKSLAGKARARPDLVKRVIEKARTDGLRATFNAVKARLDEPLPLGYSAAGSVIGVGARLEGRFQVGDRVAMAGAGVANHAEINAVPENLAVPVPAGVDDEAAAFATLAAIALHAVRNLDAKLAETVAVMGAGLVGQLAAQLLRLAGVRVIVLDYRQDRLDTALSLGAAAAVNLGSENAAGRVDNLTGGLGCDGIMIAAATDSSAPFETAAAIARDRARVCLVGLSGTEFPFADFMKKELSIVVSRSYGPGRYDPGYEERGETYPPGYVRWTETANIAACLQLMAETEPARKLNVAPLITHRFGIAEAERAYGLVVDGGEPHLGVVLTYGGDRDLATVKDFPIPAGGGACRLGVIGGGNYARSVLLPELARNKSVFLDTLITKTGASAEQTGAKFGFAHAGTDARAVLGNGEINAVVIATRHDSHGDLTAGALAAGKSVWVEKPLAIDRAGLDRIEAARETSSGFFQVGFNRRFAPLAIEAAARLSKISGPKFMLFRVNAGAVPADDWQHAPEEGGGRIVGEMCHFVDLARFFAGAPIRSVLAEAARTDAGSVDDVTATLRFEDGSLATLSYTALGDRAYPKERFEIFAGGTVLGLDNFQSLTVSENGTSSTSPATADKGAADALRAFVQAVIQGGGAPVDEAESIEVSRATLAILDSLRVGGRVDIHGNSIS